MAPKLIPNTAWLQIARSVLDGDSVARTVLTQQVRFYVRCQLSAVLREIPAERLIGLGVEVLGLICADDHTALRMWTARQAQQLDPSPWWTWIETLARFALARRSPRAIPKLGGAPVPADPARMLGALRMYHRRRAPRFEDPPRNGSREPPVLAEGTNVHVQPLRAK